MAANVIFKRGLQANLPTQLTDGHVYITTDERAMYVDCTVSGTLQRIRLGDFIEVANQTNLPSPITKASKTALYYVTNGNMLVKRGVVQTSTGPKEDWVQLNSQLTLNELISELEITASNSEGTAKVQQRILNAAGNEVVGNLTFASGNDALKVTGADSTVTYTVKDIAEKATLGTPVYADPSTKKIVEVKLTNTTTGTDADGSAVNTTAAGGSFKITGTNGTTVSIDGNNQISITGGSVDSVSQAFDANGKLITTVGAASGDVDNSADAPTPKITYGENNATSATFKSGTAALDTYTKGQVDSKISSQLRAVNAMTYKGTIGGTGATVTALPTANVSIGDTYKVNAAGLTLNGQACTIGDMWIASAAAGKTENASGVLAAADIVWTYIPSGNEEIITYGGVVNDGNFGVDNGTDNILRVDEGTDIEITKTSDTVAKIAHAAHTTNKTNGTAVTQQYNTAVTIPAITELTVSNGHVDGIKTTKYTIKDTHNELDSLTNVVTAAGNTASVKTVVASIDGGSVNGTFTVGSTGSLVVTASGKAITMDLQWGEF